MKMHLGKRLKPREIALLVITLTFMFIVGPACAHYSLATLITLSPIDTDASLKVIEALIFIPFMMFWYLLWCFVGLFAGMIVARPICGAAAISALGIAGFMHIPVLSPIYNSIVTRLYRSET